MLRLLREPLLWFVVCGALLYVVVERHRADGDHRTIRVTAADLDRYAQFRQRRFDGERTDRGPTAQRQHLVDDFVREEVLVREARRRGLDANDYVIRQRLVQRMEYLARAEAELQPADDASLNQYRLAHPDRYRRAAELSLQHVYFSGDKSRERAAAAVEALRGNSGIDAESLGDRFPYYRRYRGASAQQVAGHFGAEFLSTLLTPPIITDRWIGPLASTHGWHAVRLSEYRPDELPPLSEIREAVLADWRRQQLNEAMARHVAEQVAEYDVRLDADLSVSEPDG